MATQTVLFVTLISMRQRIVLGHVQGGVNATARAMAVSGARIGALLAGILVEALGGVRVVLVVAAAAGLANAVFGLVGPLRTDTTRASA